MQTNICTGFLRDFINQRKILSVIEIGCLNAQCSILNETDLTTYTGYDSIESVISHNQIVFPLHKFVMLDILTNIDGIACADLCIINNTQKRWDEESIKYVMHEAVSGYKFYYILLYDDKGFNQYGAECVFKDETGEVSLVSMSCDILIPVGPRDTHKLCRVVELATKNVKHHRNVYVVSSAVVWNTLKQLNESNVTWIDETSYPFQMTDIQMYHGTHGRNGWYLQQLLKLYAHQVVPGILDNVLILDSDTFILKQMDFMCDFKYMFHTLTEHHIPYFIHMAKLHPSLVRMSQGESGITHHMIFNRTWMNALFDMVQQYTGVEFWRAFLEHVTDTHASGASEYEIYFNFMNSRAPHRIKKTRAVYKQFNTIGELNTNDIGDAAYGSLHWHSSR
jgi:hypothetical protein